MKKKKQKKGVKVRVPLELILLPKTKVVPDKKKKAAKSFCRKKVNSDSWKISYAA